MRGKMYNMFILNNIPVYLNELSYSFPLILKLTFLKYRNSRLYLYKDTGAKAMTKLKKTRIFNELET